MVENRLKKVRRQVLLYAHEYRVQKIGGKKARETIFPETHEYCEQKMLGKKSSQKSAKTRFLYTHEYPDQKMVGKTRDTNFYRNTRIVQAKNVGKKIV